MLKVEQYGAPKVETQITASPKASSNISPMAFSGNQIAAAAETVGNAYNDFQTTQKRVAQTEAEDALNQFEREKNNVLFDPKSGYFNTQGRDALDQMPDVNKRLDDLKRTYSDSLKTQDGKIAFNRVADNHINSARTDIMRHSSKGLQAWEVSTAQAEVTNAVENAYLVWNDDKKLAVQRESGRQSVHELAKRKSNGSSIATNEELQNYESQFSSAAIHAATQVSSAEGKRLFAKYESTLEGPEVLKVKQLIETKENSEKVKADSDAVVSRTGDLLLKYGKLDNARSLILEEVNKIADPKQRNATMKESMYQLDRIKQAKTEEAASVFDDADKQITNGKLTVDQYISGNPEAWQKMTATQQRQLLSGKGVVNDDVAYLQLVSKPLDQLAQVNPAEYAGQLDAAHREKLTNAVLSARKGQADGITTRDQQKSARIIELMGVKTPKSQDELAKFGAMNRTVDAMLESKMKETGKSWLSDDEYRKVLSDFSRSVVTPGRIFGTNDVRLKDLPVTEIDAYSAFLKKHGMIVNTENLVKLKNNAAVREAALKEYNQ